MRRIETLASLVDKDYSVLDIGTDHAYLPIYLVKNNITTKIVASDISPNALEGAKKNLIKHGLEDKIELIVSDGFKSINKDFDIAVISGMGTENIKKILDTKKLPKTLIISTHKDHYDLRVFMNNLGYKIDKEIIIKEGKIYYDIIKYKSGVEVLSEFELLVGKIDNLEYIKYLKEKYNKLYKLSNNKKHLEYVRIIEKKLD